jgi:hypothetical protein
MKRASTELLIGGLLAAIGVIALLQNLGLFGAATDTIWALLFGVGGAAFLGVVVRNPERWWALIPGAALLSLGVLIGFSAFAPALASAWGGTIFLGGLGLGFLGVYLLRRAFWWAIIPAGVLLSLAVVAGISPRMSDTIVGPVLFIGLALTFGLVAIAPPDAPRRWAFIPAAVLLLIAVLALVNAPVVLNILGPALLILFGLALLYRAYKHTKRDDYEHSTVS